MKPTRAAIQSRIFDVLRQHVGRDRVISARSIAQEIGLRQRAADRFVRQLIHDALHDGTLEELELHVISVPGKGFFLCADIEESQRYSDLVHLWAWEAVRKAKAVTGMFKAAGLGIKPWRPPQKS